MLNFDHRKAQTPVKTIRGAASEYALASSDRAHRKLGWPSGQCCSYLALQTRPVSLGQYETGRR